ncbi:MAG: GH3 auxin-responsive promoter family protein, partial [Planctomycetaceae bacterium]|nr:GH3 auxin-responsive promoter family protein [Planctomycetaceae bacterium]
RTAVEKTALEIGQYTLIPQWGEPPRYQLLFEQSLLASTDSLPTLLDQLDRSLQETNCEYAEKRQSGRLAAPVACELTPGTWSRFAVERQKKLGGSIEQYKHPCLIPELDYARQILNRFS